MEPNVDDETNVPGAEGEPGTTSEASPPPTGENGSEAATESQKPDDEDPVRKLRDTVFRSQSKMEARLGGQISELTGLIKGIAASQPEESRQQAEPELDLRELQTLAKTNPLEAMMRLQQASDAKVERRIQESEHRIATQAQAEKGIGEVKGRLTNRFPDLDNQDSEFFHQVDQAYRRRARELGQEDIPESTRAFMIEASAQEVSQARTTTKQTQVEASREAARKASDGKTTVPAGSGSPPGGDAEDAEMTPEEQATFKKFGLTDKKLFLESKALVQTRKRQ